MAAGLIQFRANPVRKSYHLFDHEIVKFNRLKPELGEAWEFWGEVCYIRGLDYASMMGNVDKPNEFTALPLNHGKHWCYPYTLKCSKDPATVKI